MARIRSIKPELRTSLVVADWPREVRYSWVLLWGYLDDFGRGVDDLRLIVSDLFPLDRDVTERKMDSWLKRMETAGPLCRYQVDSRRFLHAINWGEHQRPSHPTPSKWPPCPRHDPEAFAGWRGLHPEPDPNPSGTSPEPLPKPSGAVRAGFVPSRTPAEQGAGSREQVLGEGVFPPIGPSSSHQPDAHDNEGPSSAADLGADAPEARQQLVAEIRRYRPDWTPGHIRGALDRLLAKPGVSFARGAQALRAVAGDPVSRRPIRVLEDGWWWAETDTRRQAALRAVGDDR